MTSEFLFLGTRGPAAEESGGGSAVRCNPMTTIEQAVCTGVRNLRACRISLRPIPQWAALEGCTAVTLTSEHDDARQARRHCAREKSRQQAQARNTPMQCEAAAAILASDGPAPVSVGQQHALKLLGIGVVALFYFFNLRVFIKE